MISLSLAGKVWELYYGHEARTQHCCSSHKCTLLINVATLETETDRL